MDTQMQQLTQFGQSIWLDNIRRSMFASGDLKRLIDQGLRGMTSNPTIFEKAIGYGNDYDEQLGSLVGTESDPGALFEALAIEDIRSACDAFRALFESTHGGDGYVSLEVSPALALDTQGTIDAAARLWKTVDRPNVMIKIPGTPEGVPAIRATIAAGINVNVTLLFSVDRYEAAAQAYIDGINDRVGRGQPVDKIASVASVFISRIDTAVDKLLDARIAKGETALSALSGKTGIANSKVLYQRFLKLFGGPGFDAARAKDAHVQRPLWASTGTKNPAFSDLMYVEGLVARDTVNTVPPQTLDALLDHGNVQADTAIADLDAAHATLDGLAKAGISLYDITEALVADGVKSFGDSFKAMLDAIAEKQRKLAAGAPENEAVSLGKSEADAAAELHAFARSNFLSNLWKHDPAPWSADCTHLRSAQTSLGWLDIPERLAAIVPELREFGMAYAKRFATVVVLASGTSAAAAAGLRQIFGSVAGYPELRVLDSVDPVDVQAFDDALDITTCVFVVISKSGTTIETMALLRYFYERVQKAVGQTSAGEHFVAVTDPGTPLETVAKETAFGKTWIDDPNVSGPYATLSYVGMVPAALAGYDVGAILDGAIGSMHAHAASVKTAAAPGLRFGAAIATLARIGRNKLTIMTHPRIAGLARCAEALSAELAGAPSGVIAIEGEPLGTPDVYGSDRIFVYIGAGLAPADDRSATLLEALEGAAHPVLRLGLETIDEIGEIMYTWQIATVAASAMLGGNPFGQRRLDEPGRSAAQAVADPLVTPIASEMLAEDPSGGTHIVPLSGSRMWRLGPPLDRAIEVIVEHIQPGDYVDFNVHTATSPEYAARFDAVRVKIRDTCKVATRVRYGVHRSARSERQPDGAGANGVVISVSGDAPFDLAIPGMAGFRALARAGARDDTELLDRRGSRGASVYFTGDVGAGLHELDRAVDGALTAKA